MSHKNLGPIGSAVLTFIGYKQTNKQTNIITDKHQDKTNLYIDIYEQRALLFGTGPKSLTYLED